MSLKITVAYVVVGLVLALIPQILWLVAFVGSKLFRFSLHYAPFLWTSLVLLVVVIGLQVYGTVWGRYQLEITHVDYHSPRVPGSFGGYKVVHISDLHLGTFLSKPEALQRVVDSINAQRPDLICFTGDIVSLGLSEFDTLKPIIAQLKARDGVVSVLGNHDLFIYGRGLTTTQRVELRDGLVDRQRSIGWQVLRNEHLVIRRGSDSLAVIGVDNYHGGGQGFKTINLGDLPKAMQGVNREDFSILLSHDPSHWEAEVVGRTSIDLTLSGHTHAAQVRLFGWSPSALMFHQDQGRFDQGPQTIYVTRGVGCTVPYRIGCPSEVTVITLR